MLNKARKIGFWVFDILSGAKVFGHFQDIKQCIDNNKSTQSQLTDILNYTIKNSQEYADVKTATLSEFPVYGKNDLRADYDKIIIGNKNQKGLHWTHTSGSTGTPLELPQNKDKRNRTKADLIFFNKKIGWELGKRYVFIRSWVKLYNVSKLRIFAQNYIRIDTNSFNDDNKEKLRQLLKEKRNVKYILSYASAITDFVKYLEQKNDNSTMFNIELVVTASDELTPSAKQRIRKMFGCRVVNRISNEEHGLLAMQFDDDNYFTLNTASYYFEILKLNSDEPAKLGELGRLVVTDLYNKKFPLIRYDIGDLAIAKSRNLDGSVSKLASFQGRSSDIAYSDDGAPITSVAISSKLSTINFVKKYQVIVNEQKIIVKIVPASQKSYDENIIQNIVTATFGKKRKIIIQKVLDIQCEKNGKYKALKVAHEKGVKRTDTRKMS